MSSVKRGRPPKRRPFDLANLPGVIALAPRVPAGPLFFELPDVEIDPRHMADELREFVKRYPGLRKTDARALQRFIEAAADALERGDAARVAWYMAHAVMCMRAAAWHEELEVPGVGRKIGRALAETGAEKLRADKRKGRRSKTP